VFRDYQPDPVQTIDGAAADQIENQIVFVFSISEYDATEAPTERTGASDGQGGDGEDDASPKNSNIDEQAREEAAPAVEEAPVVDELQDEEMADGTSQA
jgi:hypothetical protein